MMQKHVPHTERIGSIRSRVARFFRASYGQAVVLLGLSLALHGCAATFNSRGVETLKPNEVAVLLHPREPGKHWVWINSVDSIDTGEMDTVQVNLTPGKHVLEFQPNHVGVQWAHRYVCLDAAPGAVYYVDSEMVFGGYQVPWNLFIRDKATTKIVSYEGESCTAQR